MRARARSLVTRFAIAFAAGVSFGASAATAAPYLVADASTGQVLLQKDATEIWYPASLTKLMTVYVALNAVREGRLTTDTPLVMSANAARMPPSKMGFRPGTEVTLDNALKMLMVKSPNDVAVMIAEGIDGSVPAFADEMNATAARLGLHESHFVNPNGLHNPGHYSSARDMAIIARALLRDFPDNAGLFDIGALQLGNQIIRNHNGLLGRYPGADGMKTGFTCPAGFNVVATANHWGKRLIVVVLGSPSAKLRTQEAADLFDRGFAMSGGPGSLEFDAVRGWREARADDERLPSPKRGGGRRRRSRGRRRRAAARGAGQYLRTLRGGGPDSHGAFRRTPAIRPGSNLPWSEARLEWPGAGGARKRRGPAEGGQGLRGRPGRRGRKSFGECGERARGAQGRGAQSAHPSRKGAPRP